MGKAGKRARLSFASGVICLEFPWMKRDVGCRISGGPTGWIFDRQIRRKGEAKRKWCVFPFWFSDKKKVKKEREFSVWVLVGSSFLFFFFFAFCLFAFYDKRFWMVVQEEANPFSERDSRLRDKKSGSDKEKS